MFVTGLIRTNRTFDIQLSLKKNTQQAEEDGSSEKDEEDGKKEETCAKFKFFEVKQLGYIIIFVDSSPQYNKYCLMLREMRQDVVNECYKMRTQTKISSFFEHSLDDNNNVLRLMSKLTILYFMTNKFILQYAI
jgi:hypothetical protein